VDSAETYIKETALRTKIFGNSPTLDNQVVLADLTSVVGSCLFSAHEYERSAPYNTEAVKKYESILKQNSNAVIHKSYVVSLYTSGTNLVFIKDDETGEHYIKLSLVEADKLVNSSLPEFEPVYLCMYAMYDLLFADSLKADEALSISAEAYNASPDDVFVRTVYAYALLFNGYLNESVEILKPLIKDSKIKIESIEEDLRLFNLRGRSPNDASRFKEILSAD
jgi:tetratricopeptide (TPR) repeat protein